MENQNIKIILVEKENLIEKYKAEMVQISE